MKKKSNFYTYVSYILQDKHVAHCQQIHKIIKSELPIVIEIQNILLVLI